MLFVDNAEKLGYWPWRMPPSLSYIAAPEVFGSSITFSPESSIKSGRGSDGHQFAKKVC